MKKYLSFLFALILPLCLFSWFVPDSKNQIDFLILWWVAMSLVALPVLYTEIALAKRSQLSPLKGITKLTREADSSTTWRLFSWINVFILILIASGFVTVANQALHPSIVSLEVGIPRYVLALILMVVVVIVSVWGFQLGILGLIFASLAIGMQIADGMVLANFQMTSISLLEWSQAVILALVSVGAGSGLYWLAHAYSYQSDEDNSKKFKATRAVLPIWVMQLIVGTVTLLFLASKSPQAEVSVFESIALLCFSAFLLKCVVQLLQQFLGANLLAEVKGLGVIFLFGCISVLIPDNALYKLLVFSTLVSVAMLSIFAGWQMKISHLRKSINFDNEMTYNFFRIAIRLVVPLLLLVALLGWVVNWWL